MSLDISIESMNRVDLVRANGRIDSSNAKQFDDALKGIMDNGRHNIVLDLAGINYMSSAGLRSLVSAKRECNKNRGDVRLANPSDRVREVLSLAGLEAIFEVFNDAASAVGSF